MSAAPASQLERAEQAIVEHLKPKLGKHVYVDAQPDDPERFDAAGKQACVLVHFGQAQPAGTNAARLAGQVTFALIVLSRSLRGAQGGYALLEDVEASLAGAVLPGLRQMAVKRSRLESQSGGLWRWVVEVETEMTRGRIAAEAQPFISELEERGG